MLNTNDFDPPRIIKYIKHSNEMNHMLSSKGNDSFDQLEMI